MITNLVHDHENGELDCSNCEEQFGPCSCGGIIHCEYQETFRKIDGKFIPGAILVLECDNCEEYEIE